MDMECEALVFDAYGTLFDVHSVAVQCERLWPGRGRALSLLWRAKQLEYTWQRSLMQRYEDFSVVTEDALRYICTAVKIECGETHVKTLMDEYLKLATFPEVPQVLQQLGSRKLAILSNGSPAMLAPLVRNAGLEPVFAGVLSVDSLKLYKPDPRVYRLAVDALGIAASKIGFVSSNCWDACGAKSFGFTSFWINRNGAPVDDLGATPDFIVASLAELPSLIGV
jgi:2-haloacid dehalogenase